MRRGRSTAAGTWPMATALGSGVLKRSIWLESTRPATVRPATHRVPAERACYTSLKPTHGPVPGDQFFMHASLRRGQSERWPAELVKTMDAVNLQRWST